VVPNHRRRTRRKTRISYGKLIARMCVWRKEAENAGNLRERENTEEGCMRRGSTKVGGLGKSWNRGGG